jgi:transketolase
LIETYGRDGSSLPEQMSPHCVPGVEAATGSLGHGLSLGVGMALAGRIRRQPYRVCVLLSDGECNEGSVWEAAMFAAAQRIDSLVVLVDYNGWQATGRTDDIMALGELHEKWNAFGWHSVDVDGHNFAQLTAELAGVPQSPGKPTALVARTVKGRGVSFMEDDNNWHYRIPTEDEVRTACAELGQA